jgi:hypothetical protein
MGGKALGRDAGIGLASVPEKNNQEAMPKRELFGTLSRAASADQSPFCRLGWTFGLGKVYS